MTLAEQHEKSCKDIVLVVHGTYDWLDVIKWFLAEYMCMNDDEWFLDVYIMLLYEWICNKVQYRKESILLVLFIIRIILSYIEVVYVDVIHMYTYW